MKIIYANRIAPDGTPRLAASHLGYSVCLGPIKRTPGLYRFGIQELALVLMYCMIHFEIIINHFEPRHDKTCFLHMRKH